MSRIFGEVAALYLGLLRTFSTYRQRSPADQRLAVANLGAAIDGWGGSLRLDLHTVLVLARATAG